MFFLIKLVAAAAIAVSGTAASALTFNFSFDDAAVTGTIFGLVEGKNSESSKITAYVNSSELDNMLGN